MPLNRDRIAICVGRDLWRYQSADGRGLRPTLNWLAGYVGKENSWPHPEIAFAKGGKIGVARREAMENFRTAAWGLRDPALEGMAAHYANFEPKAEEHIRLSPFDPKVTNSKN